jgi:hypothetical protein
VAVVVAMTGAVTEVPVEAVQVDLEPHLDSQ